MEINFNARNQIKLNTLYQVKELVQSNLKKIEPIMDDYDGGQKAAYVKVLTDINAYEAIIGHTEKFNQEEPGIDC